MLHIDHGWTDVTHLCEYWEGAHGVGVPVEGEVPEAGDEDAHGDEADAEGEEDGGEGLPEHHHGQHEVDEGRAALDGAVHRDVHPVQRDQGQSTEGRGHTLIHLWLAVLRIHSTIIDNN